MPAAAATVDTAGGQQGKRDKPQTQPTIPWARCSATCHVGVDAATADNAAATGCVVRRLSAVALGELALLSAEPCPLLSLLLFVRDCLRCSRLSCPVLY